MAINNKEPNDKDHYANKRVRLAGDLIEDLTTTVRWLVTSSTNLSATTIASAIEDYLCLRPDVLTSKVMHALATGNWVGGRSGVSQLLIEPPSLRLSLTCAE